MFIVVVVWIKGFAAEDDEAVAWEVVGLCSLLLTGSLGEVVEVVRGLVEVDTVSTVILKPAAGII